VGPTFVAAAAAAGSAAVLSLAWARSDPYASSLPLLGLGFLALGLAFLRRPEAAAWWLVAIGAGFLGLQFWPAITTYPFRSQVLDTLPMWSVRTAAAVLTGAITALVFVAAMQVLPRRAPGGRRRPPLLLTGGQRSR
jgi:hypothetical protein